jgi:hypothetical protein
MSTKKIYTRPTVNKTVIDREASLVMGSVHISSRPLGLLKWLR